MISKEKGNIGEAIVLAEFVKRGIQVSIPFGDNARYDLIAEFNGRLNKIQVKYCNDLSKNNSIVCPCSSSLNHTTNKNRTTYEEDIDYFAFYLVPWDMCILVPIEKVGSKKSMLFRQIKPANGQSNYNDVKDYTFEKILNL